MPDTFRSFVEHLDREGELIRIAEAVEWKYEIGHRTRKATLESETPPALLFENITGYKEWRVLTNAMGSPSKINMALGLASRTPHVELIRVLRERLKNPISPVIAEAVEHPRIESGIRNCALTDLPVPWWNSDDIGRYLGTWHLNITKDPDTGIRNVGVYRMQLVGPHSALVSVSPRSDLAAHLKKAERRGLPLEMAVAIGVDERLVMAAGMAPPCGVDEYALAGALALHPIKIRKCNSVDLEVPCEAEIVIEGKVLPNRRTREGPFVDYTGVSKGNPEGLVFDATFLSHRHDPIFRGATLGLAGAEDHLIYALLASVGCLDFHGSKARQLIQNVALRRRHFSVFQTLGKLRQMTRSMILKGG